MTGSYSSAAARTGDALLVRIRGHATREYSPTFVQNVSEMLEQESCSLNLVIDLQQCGYLDSTFLGSLVMLFQRTEGRMQLCVGPVDQARLFASARIDRLIPICLPESVCLPEEWDFCVDSAAGDDLILLTNVALAHRCLADVEGPNCELYRDVAYQLEYELTQSAQARAVAAGERPAPPSKG